TPIDHPCVSSPAMQRVPGLASFPTRRSSDLSGRGKSVLTGQHAFSRCREVGRQYRGHAFQHLRRQRRGKMEGTGPFAGNEGGQRSEEHTSELQSREKLVCRLARAAKNERARR